MRKIWMTLFALTVALSAEASNDSFPGKGSYNDWRKAAIHYGKGVDAMERGVSTEAISYFKTAIDIYPYDAHFYNNIANSYALLKENELAETNERKAIALAPNEARYQLFLAKIVAAQGRLEEAQSIADKINADGDSKTQQRLAKFQLDLNLLKRNLRVGPR